MNKEDEWEQYSRVKEKEAPIPPSLGAPTPPSLVSPLRLLDIAKAAQSFIDSNGWPWCAMERVYRILKAVNGGG